jgi:hypothetical protein
MVREEAPVERDVVQLLRKKRSTASRSPAAAMRIVMDRVASISYDTLS